MSKSVESVEAATRLATRPANTVTCWEVQVAKIEFASDAGLFILKEYQGVEVCGAVVAFQNARLMRTRKQFRLFIGPAPSGLCFAHASILKVWDEAGIIAAKLDDADVPKPE